MLMIKEPVDFSSISKRNKSYAKLEVSVANGVCFFALNLPLEKIVLATNILYMHVHRKSRKCYIGVTEQRAGARWMNGNGYKANPRFSYAVKKYGWESFESYILAFGNNRESLNIVEPLAIKVAGGHKSKYTYNLSPGGDFVAENDKPLVGVLLTTGEQRRFKSGAHAARTLKMKNVDMPMAVARGERLSVADWWFRFADDTDAKPPEMWGEALRIDAVRKKHGKRVIAINHVTNEERRFSTTSEAAKVLNVEQTAVSAIARGKAISAKDWWFKFEDDSREKPESYGNEATRKKRDIKIYATNLITGEKREFRNCTVADTELGIYAGAASAVALSTITSAHGWWFSYDSEAVAPTEFKGALVAKARSKGVIAIQINTGEQFYFTSAKTASASLGMSRAAISKSANGITPFVKGYQFRFA